jgi:hypothetical protein
MKDFFISYNHADKTWAEWIAWTLEEAGYTVVIQSWDFRPGNNFVLEMARAAEGTRKTIAVLSQDYLNAAFTQSEWAAAFASDPLSNEHKLIPIRVRDCKPEGLLSSIIYIDLVGLSQRDARSAILGALTERAKPDHPPFFPAEIQHTKVIQPQFPQSEEKIEVFFSYSHRDERLRDELAKHLSLLKRQGIITEWNDREIGAGTQWEDEIDKHLNLAQIVLLLVSADFIASDYCYGEEMMRAMERHKNGEARVIPIILRASDWQSSPFGKLQALPRDAKPVTSWTNRDEAFASIAEGIRLACREIKGNLIEEVHPKVLSGSELTTAVRYSLVDVFKYPGVPDVTFVEPEKFYLLKLALKQPGLGVIIEGPSGIGKTTALRKAVEQLGAAGEVTSFEILSARRSEDTKRIQYIEQWHKNTLAIDDFHRLEEPIRNHVADYLKDLADRESPAKLIIIGIPGTYKKLVEIAFDLGTRIRSFKLGRVNDEIILSMINKGESALNIIFDRKSEIARASGGSLNIAQILCSNLVAQAGIDQTQLESKLIRCDLEGSVMEVMEQLDPKFHEVVRCFAALDGHAERTCIGLLEELAQADNGFLSLAHVKDKRFDLSAGIDRFVSEKYMDQLREKFPAYERYLYYDNKSHALIIDDPQLAFYLVRTPASRLVHEAGKI